MNIRLKHAHNWLELAREANWSVVKLAERCDVSVRTLERHFIKTKGKTPKAWLTEQRQKKAICLLRDGSSIKEIAFQLGYDYAHHFSREFKQYWGCCPSIKTLSSIKTNKSRDLV